MPTLHDTELHMHKDACVLTADLQKTKTTTFEVW